ncbi:MAG: hypothetical protein ACP5PX_00365 [Candidatus Hadarchaeum sp.]|uniref:hypothetical protein n=1 Tax=Candidatus Hadarchaeum sp. TaxID=2883567 RepID=UPI003D0C57A5
MTIDIKPLVKLMKKRDLKGARDWLEANRGKIDPNDEFARGYLLALQGMVSALESGGELAAINKVLEKKYSGEQIAEIISETRSRIAQKFRPADERGFNTAWVDILSELSVKNPED